MKKYNKNGEITGEVVLYIPKFIFLIAVLFAVVILVKIFIITVTDVREVESNVLITRLLYSKGGLSYYDEDINRLYPGVIDLIKFEDISSDNPNILDGVTISYGSDNPIIAAKITLVQDNEEDIDVYYNREGFDKWEPRLLSSVQGGAGSVRGFKEQKYVLVKEGEDISSGILKFFVIS